MKRRSTEDMIIIMSRIADGSLLTCPSLWIGKSEKDKETPSRDKQKSGASNRAPPVVALP